MNAVKFLLALVLAFILGLLPSILKQNDRLIQEAQSHKHIHDSINSVRDSCVERMDYYDSMFYISTKREGNKYRDYYDSAHYAFYAYAKAVKEKYK